MELISRITLRRHEIGAAGEDDQRHVPAQSLAIFRVLGRSPERAIKILGSEMARQPDQVMALSFVGNKLSEVEKRICSAAIELGIRQAARIVFCGGDPLQIFGRLGIDGKAPKWFRSIPSFVSSFELDGGRQSANHA